MAGNLLLIINYDRSFPLRYFNFQSLIHTKLQVPDDKLFLLTP